jgi:hypothetical protein
VTKVRLIVNTKGARSGDVIDVAPDVAKALIANRNAVAVKPAPKKSDED